MNFESTNSDRYVSFLNQFQLESPESIASFFAASKHDLYESLRARTHRLFHYLRTGVWVSERALFTWAASHPKKEISSLLKGRPIQRKVFRYERRMAVLPPPFLSKCVTAVRFFGQFLRNPGTIGAILPSSGQLAKRIVSEIQKNPSLPSRRILEIGPGTGAFTDKIIDRLNPGDTLHLVEFDETLANELRQKYKGIRMVKVFQCSILNFTVPEDGLYDHVISGLPLNSFTPQMVSQVFEKYATLPKDGGTLSYFDYRFLPTLRRAALDEKERAAFDEILRRKETFFAQHGTKEETVLGNAPPARVLHHRLGPLATAMQP